MFRDAPSAAAPPRPPPPAPRTPAHSSSPQQSYDEDEDGDGDAGGGADVENEYYNAKQYKDDEPDVALEGFRRVVELEGEERGDWGFKAQKQIVKLHLRRGEYAEMMGVYRTLLGYAVARTYAEKSVGNMMDKVAAVDSVPLFEQFFAATLPHASDRLAFKARIKLARLFLEHEMYHKLAPLLRELEAACKGADGADDPRKGTQLFEIFALKFPMLAAQRNTKELKREYRRALQIDSAIPHPQIMGVIRECGGRMHIAEEEYAEAYSDFFEAFKNYDECGSSRRLNSLKMLVLANMLMKSEVDPFDAQESKPYKDNPEIKAMTDLVRAYQDHSIADFEKILRANRKNLTEDPVISEHIAELLRNIRIQVLVKLIRPYTRVRIPYLAAQLKVDEADVEALVVACILDGSIAGHIDQPSRVLLLRSSVGAKQRYSAIDAWGGRIGALLDQVTARLG